MLFFVVVRELENMSFKNGSKEFVVYLIDLYSKMIIANLLLFTIVLHWVVDYCRLIIVTGIYCTLTSGA